MQNHDDNYNEENYEEDMPNQLNHHGYQNNNQMIPGGEENGEEYLDDDIYLVELHKRLGQMKNERKKAEMDARLLDNRLRLLKGEEEKNWKKISTTKKKTNEKIINLQKMAEVMRQKQEIKDLKEKEIEVKKEMNQRMKQEIQTNTHVKREEKIRQINEEARLLKLQKQYNLELARYLKMEEMNNNKNKCETIKSGQMMMEEKRKALEMERKMKAKMELEKKLLDEYRLKEEAEVYLNVMF
jgi:hypothetical protein